MASYAESGQWAGDLVSVGIGAIEQGLGLVGVASGTGAAPVTGGTSLAVTIESTAVVAHGFVVTQTALSNLSGENNTVEMRGSNGGDRAGKNFTPKGKREVVDANRQRNGGQTVCEDCNTTTVPSQRSQRGVTPPGNETQVDHIYPKSRGGDGSPSNGQVLCRDCNRTKGNSLPDEYYKE